MTRSNRPRTLHQLMEWRTGRPPTRLEAATTPDRTLTHDEQRAVKRERMRIAELNRAGRCAHVRPRGVSLGGLQERTVGYYRRAVVRFERWAARAERLGLPRGQPPGHIAEKARDVVAMTAREAGARAG